MWRRAIIALLICACVIPNLFRDPTIAAADSVTPNINNGTWDRSLNTAGNDQLIGLTYSLRTLLWTAGVVLESSQSILTRVANTAFYQDQLGGFVKKKKLAPAPKAAAKADGISSAISVILPWSYSYCLLPSGRFCEWKAIITNIYW